MENLESLEILWELNTPYIDLHVAQKSEKLGHHQMLPAGSLSSPAAALLQSAELRNPPHDTRTKTFFLF